MKHIVAKVNKKLLTACAIAATAATTFAEDPENPLSSVVTEATGYLSVGKTVVVTILSAGLVIVAAFFVWKLIKKGLSSAK